MTSGSAARGPRAAAPARASRRSSSTCAPGRDRDSRPNLVPSLYPCAMQTFAPERDIVSWDDLDGLVAGLADRLRNTRFDVLLAITRGGLVPAGMLAYRLGIRNILVAAVEFYDAAGRPGPHPTFLPFPPDPPPRGPRVLGVGEGWGSGTPIPAGTPRVRPGGGEATP